MMIQGEKTSLSLLSILHRFVKILPRLIIGVVFIGSGVLKLINPTEAIALLDKIIPDAIAFNYLISVILSIAELTAGCLLLFNRYILTTSFLISVFLLFSTFVGVLFINNPVPCGCFSGIIESRTDEIFLARNIVLLFLSVTVLKLSLDTSKNDER
jgi:uncharacterized membrane protein YphA (DoxX/SURF4 family)